MAKTILQRAAKDLKAGDLLDLEGVTYAGDNPLFEFEYIQCVGVELETPDCVRVDYDGGAFGCPPDTLISVWPGGATDD